MKKWIKFELTLLIFALLISTMIGCRQVSTENKKKEVLNTPQIESSTLKPNKLSPEFKSYWYAGKAEVTSYILNQSRYGENRNGTAVLIFVTEPFLKDKQVKADRNNPSNIPVLKLNSTKKYVTGIYPYSIMTSSFLPVKLESHALKVSFSAQEWCGHVYAQLNNKVEYEITSHSYFESEGDENFSLNKSFLEDEIWSKIRINPDNLPIGEIEIIPSFEFTRLSHREFKAYKATAKMETKNDSKRSYSLYFPELERSLEIEFTTKFPFTIEGWTETYKSGFGTTSKLMTTTAVKNKSIITPYWQQNKNSDLFLRDSLGI